MSRIESYRNKWQRLSQSYQSKGKWIMGQFIHLPAHNKALHLKRNRDKKTVTDKDPKVPDFQDSVGIMFLCRICHLLRGLSQALNHEGLKEFHEGSQRNKV